MHQGLPQSKDLLDTDAVAAYLGVGSVTVWRRCREGVLPCLKIGRGWRIRREALEGFLKRNERSIRSSGVSEPYWRCRITYSPRPRITR